MAILYATNYLYQCQGPWAGAKVACAELLPGGFQKKAMNAKKGPGVYENITFDQNITFDRRAPEHNNEDIKAALGNKVTKELMQIKKVAMSRAGIHHR
jgi:hypothetical protein